MWFLNMVRETAGLDALNEQIGVGNKIVPPGRGTHISPSSPLPYKQLMLCKFSYPHF